MKMINLLAALLLAALAQASTSTAYAGTDPYVVLHDTTVSSDCTDWNPGAAPFAATETESVANLPGWLSVLLQQGRIQPGDIAIIVKTVHDNPQGTPSTIIRGAHFDFMASSERGKPVVSNLCYEPNDNSARTKDGFAISYKALNALTWVIDLPGNRRLLFSRFFICYNWAGEWMDIPPPPPATEPEPECAELDVTVPPGGYVLHSGLFARRQLTTRCREIFGDGRAILCDECSANDALNELRGRGYLLNTQPHNGFKFKCNSPEGCVLRMHEPMSATVRTDDDIFWLCLTGPDGSTSYLLKDVHWYSFISVNGGVPIAYVGDAPADWVAAGGVPRMWHEVRP